MRLLVVHNKYQLPGGEDVVFEQECALLARAGHEVSRYCVSNDRIKNMGRLALFAKTIWSLEASREIRAAIQRWQPELVHFHNTFPLISPAAYYAVKSEGLPIVQTIHNYRIACPAANLFRDGRLCELCLGRKVAWPSVVHRCYRKSAAATATVSAMLATHHVLRTWHRHIDRYIVLSEFARRKLLEAGLPRDKVVVKPNFVDPDPGVGSGTGGFALYVGRLSPEKGISLLLTAFSSMSARHQLVVVGDGPSAPEVVAMLRAHPNVQWLGALARDEVCSLMKSARVLVVPSLCYENFPLSIVEAFSVGLPVLASRLGSLEGLVEVGRTGFLFRPGDVMDLATKLGWMLDGPDELASVRKGARLAYESRFTGEQNVDELICIYKQAQATHLLQTGHH